MTTTVLPENVVRDENDSHLYRYTDPYLSVLEIRFSSPGRVWTNPQREKPNLSYPHGHKPAVYLTPVLLQWMIDRDKEIYPSA